MFQPKEYVVYGRSGVCVVEGVERIGGKEFYCLRSLYQNCQIKTPVNGKTPVRPVLTREQANALIDKIPAMEMWKAESGSSREMGDKYRAAILSQTCEDLVGLTMTIYAKKQAALGSKKKISSTDLAFLKEGEGLLFGELAVALGIPFEEVQPYIKSRVEGPGGIHG